MRMRAFGLMVFLLLGCEEATRAPIPREVVCPEPNLPAEVRYHALEALLGDLPQSRQHLDRVVNLFQYSVHPETLPRDRQGHTLLDHLFCMAVTPRAGRLSQRAWLSQALSILAEPETIHQGAYKVTCGAAVAEYLLARQYPAELARLISGLTSAGMSATMASGATIHGSYESYAPDNSGRLDVDRIVQSALMDEALLAFDYDNTADRGLIDRRQYWGETGTYTSRIANLLYHLTGQPYQYQLTQPPASRKLLNFRVLPRVQKGHLVLVSVAWSGYGHMLVVTGQETDSQGTLWFHLKNPWGPFDRLWVGPKRERLDDRGNCRMTVDELARILRGVVDLP